MLALIHLVACLDIAMQQVISRCVSHVTEMEISQQAFDVT